MLTKERKALHFKQHFYRQTSLETYVILIHKIQLPKIYGITVVNIIIDGAIIPWSYVNAQTYISCVLTLADSIWTSARLLMEWRREIAEFEWEFQMHKTFFSEIMRTSWHPSYAVHVYDGNNWWNLLTPTIDNAVADREYWMVVTRDVRLESSDK